MTWVKICGITNLEDARVAVDAGADALGFVFYQKSPRKVDPDKAREIIAKLPQPVEKVGVFVDEAVEEIRDAAATAGLTAAQVHLTQGGAERVRDFHLLNESDGLKIIAAFPANKFAEDSLFTSGSAKKTFYALLLDSGSSSMPGGTGKAFDWTKANDAIRALGLNLPIIVAGGLTPQRVGRAMKVFRPWGVDVSSGVEARPGRKDPEKVRAFIAAVRQEDAAGR
jgi:phosphoribosylanthranilate isomerase